MELEVSVLDGQALIQRAVCTRTAMPDGTEGVIWRGLAYPLLRGDSIDVNAAPTPEAELRFAVLPGEEASWVLIQGLPAALATARSALTQGGVSVTRSGRWLGDAVGETAFDWFLRCEGRLEASAIAVMLGGVSLPESASDTRLIILEQRIADLSAKLAGVQTDLQRSVERRAAPDPALQDALAQIQSLRDTLAEVQTAPTTVVPPAQNLRLHDEMLALISALRHDIVLLRDSLHVALGDFQSRAGFYQALSELSMSGSRPEGWKKFHAAERWWECHVSTGRNDHGRAYARFDTGARRWNVLLSWKVDQAQDTKWLKRWEP